MKLKKIVLTLSLVVGMCTDDCIRSTYPQLGQPQILRV